MPAPLAYFLTWTGHGTRLHGDPRGSVDRIHNRVGTPLLPDDPDRVDEAVSLLAHEPFVLNNEGRAVVEQAIRDHCGQRGWVIHALNVRTTHVHLVIDCRGSHTPEAAMAQLKSWSTRRLIAANLAERGRRLWTHHGSTRWLNTPHSLAQAIEYVLHEQ
jgi:REP element-mobilizing transposase RayT